MDIPIRLDFFVKVLKKVWWIMLIAAVIAGAAAGAYTHFLVPNQYASSVEFYVVNVDVNSDYTSGGLLSATERMANDYALLLRGDDAVTILSDVWAYVHLLTSNDEVWAAWNPSSGEEQSADVLLQPFNDVTVRFFRTLKNKDAGEGFSDFRAELKKYPITPRRLSLSEIRGMMQTRTTKETSMFVVSAVSANPDKAYDLASLLAVLSSDYLTNYTKGSEIYVDVPSPGGDGSTVTGTYRRTECLRVNTYPVLPTAPVAPNPMANTVRAGAITLVAVYAIAVVVAVLNTTIHTEQDLTAAVKAPLLGVCPTWDAAGRGPGGSKKRRGAGGRGRRASDAAGDDGCRVLSDATPFAIREVFNQVRTNLIYSPVDQRGGAVYAVTSVDAGTGKSTMVANLAIAYAALSRRVLLVDADLRCPVLHQMFRAPKRQAGLGDLLVGEATEEAVIRPTEISGLSLITSGHIPPNPAELVASERFARLLDQWRKEYDVVLIDLPPAGVVNDPLSICRNVSGYLFVVRANMSDSKRVKKIMDDIERLEGRVIGMILNDVNPKSGSRGGYYYRDARYYGRKYVGAYEQSFHAHHHDTNVHGAQTPTEKESE